MKTQIKKKVLALAMGLLLFVGIGSAVPVFDVVKVRAATGDDDSGDTDFEKYLNYDKFKKDDRRSKYRKYKKAKDKYGFDSSKEKFAAKACYRVIKDLRKAGAVKAVLKATHPCYEGYKDYKRYKKYYSPLKKYRKYRKYDKDEYDQDGKYDKYDKENYKKAYERYRKTKGKNQANLGGNSLGPEITVGILSFTRDQLGDDSFRLKANKDYVIKSNKNKVIATVLATQDTRVKYYGDKKLRVYNYDPDVDDEEMLISSEVRFEAADGKHNEMIFEITKPDINCYGDNCNEYRGKLELKHSNSTRKTWVINTLPLEHYVWGMGEITGTGDMEYNRVMTISYRTYGYWKIKYSTKFASEGFKVNATPGNQLYFGYDWETGHDRIKTAAQNTRGKLVLYDGRIAITPYSSYTDGRTRSWEEHWGSKNYPWCQSVKDPYGKHPSMSTKKLFAAGNHMVGLSAHGALDRADHGWNYERILNYYYDGIDIFTAY